jgi:toxin ParE1/3/4
MGMDLIWTPRARKEREAQIDRIAHVDPQAALEHLDAIEHHTDMLALPGNSEIGRQGRQSGTRELVVSKTKFVVVYRVKPKAKRIEILRVLHSSQAGPA